jgi:hypothetical protein
MMKNIKVQRSSIVIEEQHIAAKPSAVKFE